MSFATLFSGLAARLFAATPPEAGATVDPELVKMGVEAVVDAVDPRLRTMSGYSKKMAPAIARTIAHLIELGRLLPQPIALSRSAWAQEGLLNVVFATADDVPALLGGSQELRAFFADPQNAGATEVHALLGMLKTEREVFGPAIVEGSLRQDVAQTTVSFSHHRLLCAAADAALCRRETGVRLLRRLAELALKRITALEELATELEQRKAVLGAKLRMLHLRRNGLEQIARDPGDLASQIASMEHALKTTVDDYVETRTSLHTLQTRLYHIEAVFGAPAEHLKLERVPLRVSRLGYKVAAGSDEPAFDLTLNELTLGDGQKGVIAFVRVARGEMPSAESLAARGRRALL